MTNPIAVSQRVRRAAAAIYQNFHDRDYAAWILDRTNAGGDYNPIIQLMHAFEAEIRADERERAANIGYVTCAKTRHVRLGDEVSDAIRNQKDHDHE